MKIVHVVPALIKGGGERVAVDLANAAAAEGHEVTMLAVFAVDEDLQRWRLVPEVEVRYILPGAAGRLRRLPAGLLWIRRNWSWLASRDVVHCHMTEPTLYGTLIRLVRQLSGAARPAVVETNHAVGMPLPGWYRVVQAWMCARRDGLALVATDPFWRGFLRRHPTLPAAVIPNGVDAARGSLEAELRRAYRRSAGIPESCRMVLGTVGMFRPERRPRLVAEIFARVANDTPDDVHFVMAGDGRELEPVRAAIRARGLAHRIHTPGLARDPREAMSAMDLYFTLNVGSITGIAALEAAFSGVPVIALQLDESHESGPQDWIWSHGDPAAVADRAVALLGDAAARAELAESQLAHVEAHHTIEAMYGAYAALYSRALAAAAPARLAAG